jgi:hypothetical protein
MAPVSQILEPPTNPGRFRPALFRGTFALFFRDRANDHQYFEIYGKYLQQSWK